MTFAEYQNNNAALNISIGVNFVIEVVLPVSSRKNIIVAGQEKAQYLYAAGSTQGSLVFSACIVIIGMVAVTTLFKFY